MKEAVCSVVVFYIYLAAGCRLQYFYNFSCCWIIYLSRIEVCSSLLLAFQFKCHFSWITVPNFNFFFLFFLSGLLLLNCLSAGVRLFENY